MECHFFVNSRNKALSLGLEVVHSTGALPSVLRRPAPREAANLAVARHLANVSLPCLVWLFIAGLERAW